MARLNGTIKRLMSDKGFGFVASEEGNEYFFHQSACNGVQFYELRYFFHQSACNGVQFYELREGQAVTFDEGEGPKGPRAENVSQA